MTVLITGADGYLGSRIAAALQGEDLVLGVRAADARELALKTAKLAHLSGSVVPMDLRYGTAFDAVDAGRITRIIHAAAVTRFDVDRATAWEVNVRGTSRVAAFAQRCSRLERLMQLSTLYTAGRRHGHVFETRHDDRGFANHYEWSKWLGEECVLDLRDVPVSVVRLPTVIAEDESGAIGQYNAFHHTLRLYSLGLLTMLPGFAETPLSFATAEFTIGAVLALVSAAPGSYHVCSGQVSLRATLDTAYTAFSREPAFQRRMLPSPILCDRESFQDMMIAAQGLRGGELHAALGWVGPFAEQLYLPKVFHTERLRAACPDLPTPSPLAVVEAACAHLIAGRTYAVSR